MPRFLLDHLKGCTPTKPCLSCEAISFLKSKLTNEDMEHFSEILERATGVPLKTSDLSSPFEDVLELSVRTTNCLRNSGLASIRDVIARTDEELLLIPNFARKCLNELVRELTKKGYSLATK